MYLVQSSAKRRRPGLVNFVSAVAYQSCLSLPAAFTQPGRGLLAKPCTSHMSKMQTGGVQNPENFLDVI